jgi:hypothetical protein
VLKRVKGNQQQVIPLEEYIMAGKIFYRERTKSKEGARQPRFRIIAVCDLNLKIYGDHFRKKELEKIATVTGAELVALERDKDSKVHK